ncbi:hypothetical protein Pfo_025793 [Paulownia fortunei]|nr:hypothetical protein Pfo_025793 [Paulownia fortunei]
MFNRLGLRYECGGRASEPMHEEHKEKTFFKETVEGSIKGRRGKKWDVAATKLCEKTAHDSSYESAQLFSIFASNKRLSEEVDGTLPMHNVDIGCFSLALTP